MANGESFEMKDRIGLDRVLMESDNFSHVESI